MKGKLRSLRALFDKRGVEQEMNEELAFHLEMEQQQRMSEGMTPAEARRAALLAFGGVERYREQVQRARWISLIDDLIADLRYAVRGAMRKPGFTVAVVITLALGIGGTTSIFSVVDNLFLRTPAGVQDAESIRRLYLVRDEGGIRTPEGGTGSYLDYTALSTARGFASVGTYLSRMVDLGRGVEAQQIRGAAVSHTYFDVLRVQPARGRFFLPEEDVIAGKHSVAVISHALWQTHFGGAADVLERTLVVNGQQLSVVGVAPKGFAGVDTDPIALWLPMANARTVGVIDMGGDDWRTQEGMAMLPYIARLSPGITDAAALADASAAVKRMAEAYPSMDQTPRVVAAKLSGAIGPYSPVSTNKSVDLSLWIALVAALVLVIACANVANLLLARAISRRRETAVRLSLGAGRFRLTRQHLTEAMLLALMGGVAGLVVARWGMALMRQFPLPPTAGELDTRLLMFALALSLFTGLLFGVLPSIRAVRVDPQQGLRDVRSANSMSRNRTRRALVAVQVALSLALLVGAALCVRSLQQVYSIDGGVDMNRLVVVNVNLQKAGLAPEERETFYQQAIARATRVPGVISAGMVHFSPFSGAGYATDINMPGVELDFDEGPYFNAAGPGYFATAGLELLAGREFEPRDATGEPTVVLNETLARAIAPTPAAVVGQCIQLDEQVKEGGCTRIIGVVETQRKRLLEDKQIPMLFRARDRDPDFISWGGPTLVVRVDGRARDHAPAVRAAVQSVRADLPYVIAKPMEELVRRDIQPYRLGASLFSLFGVLALALAAIGLYGVLGYFVTERTHEIGIRRSLGAPITGVVSLVMRQSMLPVLTGLIVGLALGFIGSRFLASMLFPAGERDPIAFVAAVGFLLLTAVIATAVPARRAARVNPMVALRQD